MFQKKKKDFLYRRERRDETSTLAQTGNSKRWSANLTAAVVCYLQTAH